MDKFVQEQLNSLDLDSMTDDQMCQLAGAILALAEISRDRIALLAQQLNDSDLAEVSNCLNGQCEERGL